MEGSKSSGIRAMASDDRMVAIKVVLCWLCVCGFGVGLMMYVAGGVIKNYIKYHEPSVYIFIFWLILLGLCCLCIILFTGGAFLAIYFRLHERHTTTTTTSDKDANAETQLHHEV